VKRTSLSILAAMILAPGLARASGFRPAGTLTVGKFPARVATADFNHDGKIDIAAANEGDGTVSILLGNGDGTFQPAQTFAADAGSEGIGVGDLNHDGNLDLIVANPYNASGGDVSVLLGNGDGTFQAPVNYLAGVSPDFVSVGDFNEDGKLDFEVVNSDYAGGSISVFLGNGDGSFQAPATYDVGRSPTESATADLNGDGSLDLVVANYIGHSVSILFGNGDGTFQPQVTINILGASSIQIGDVNHDRKPDIVVGDFDPNHYHSGRIWVLLGNGDGSFQTAKLFPTGTLTKSVILADFNRDGNLDVASSSGNRLSVLLGNGDGTFGGKMMWFAGKDPLGLAAGDFHGTGSLDVVLADFDRHNLILFQNTF
jgi:VCBS repeat protein